ncbi:MAG: hypothetical protein CMC76_08000 [Flavobacteriaceae bacterium]|nr:hypothetical protein [Flavobacteriaceae bacterium]
MTKFFKNIRKSLLNEGKTSKYLKYAIGEIILVVIGILIALQINNWKDYKKNRVEEQQVLKNFKEDLETDKKLLDEFKGKALSYSKSADTILLSINEAVPFDPNKFIGHASAIISNIYFESSSSTFDQSLSTGKIDLVENAELRKGLLEYYKLTKLNFDDKRISETNQNFVFPEVFSQIVATKEVSEQLTGIATKLPQFDLHSLATNRAFSTWVILKKLAFREQSTNYTELSEKVMDLISKIDEEIERNN